MPPDSTEQFDIGPVDIFVIGGGVNGCGVARDAAGRGYTVCLAEMNDLASGTSSKATKLIHGGLRYLEFYEFRLVREALAEREILLRAAPHIIKPIRFVLPWRKGLRPKWLLRLGLLLYDHIGGRKALPPTRTLDLRRDAAGLPLKPEFTDGFEYSDCQVDDSRLVALNARDAADHGAEILTGCEMLSARSDGGLWRLRLRQARTGKTFDISARVLVNAAGPWVDRALDKIAGRRQQHGARLVQGAHIVVKKFFEHDKSYIFQHPDGRVVFVIPFEDKFALIGTTDLEYKGDPADTAISPAEADYLRQAASAYFARPIAREDVVASFSGVRPLYDDHASKAQEATRDYVLTDETIAGAPLINIFGGKITTYRRLAEKVLVRVGRFIGDRGAPWTEKAPLPGGDFPDGDVNAFCKALLARKPFLPGPLAARYARSYGTACLQFLEGARTMADLGRDFGAGLTAAEIDYLVDREWARTADDILWRRSKRGLVCAPSTRGDIDAYLAERASRHPTSQHLPNDAGVPP